MNGIDVTNGGSFFEHQTTENNFVILDPINDQDNNTSKNSYMTHQILGSFRKAFNTLKNVLVNYQNLKNPNITDNLLDILLEQNQSVPKDIDHEFFPTQEQAFTSPPKRAESANEGN